MNLIERKKLKKIKIEAIFTAEVEYKPETYMTHDGPMSYDEAMAYERESTLENIDDFVGNLLDAWDSQENSECFKVRVTKIETE